LEAFFHPWVALCWDDGSPVNACSGQQESSIFFTWVCSSAYLTNTEEGQTVRYPDALQREVWARFEPQPDSLNRDLFFKLTPMIFGNGFFILDERPLADHQITSLGPSSRLSLPP
jgi:hypothetical protein